jgi:hypothetical protein
MRIFVNIFLLSSLVLVIVSCKESSNEILIYKKSQPSWLFSNSKMYMGCEWILGQPVVYVREIESEKRWVTNIVGRRIVKNRKGQGGNILRKLEINQYDREKVDKISKLNIKALRICGVKDRKTLVRLAKTTYQY